eukprot:scaffold1105_cov140-Isochrysis_galbana.AAC.5
MGYSQSTSGTYNLHRYRYDTYTVYGRGAYGDIAAPAARRRELPASWRAPPSPVSLCSDPEGPEGRAQPLEFGTGYVTALRNSSAKHALHAHRRIRTRAAYRVLVAGDWVRMRDFRVLVCYGSRVSESEWVSG